MTIKALARLKTFAAPNQEAELIKAAKEISKKFGKPDDDLFGDFGRKIAPGRTQYTWLADAWNNIAKISISIDERNFPGKITLFSQLMWPTLQASATTSEKLLNILATRATKNLIREEKWYKERLPKAIDAKAKKDIQNRYEIMTDKLKKAISLK